MRRSGDEKVEENLRKLFLALICIPVKDFKSVLMWAFSEIHKADYEADRLEFLPLLSVFSFC